MTKDKRAGRRSSRCPPTEQPQRCEIIQPRATPWVTDCPGGAMESSRGQASLRAQPPVRRGKATGALAGARESLATDRLLRPPCARVRCAFGTAGSVRRLACHQFLSLRRSDRAVSESMCCESKQVFGVIFDASFFHHALQLLFPSHPCVMSLLVANVAAHRLKLRRAHGHGEVAVLPAEHRRLNLLVYPFRGTALDVAEHFGKRMDWSKADEDVHVIAHTVDCVSNATDVSDGTAQPGVQTGFPLGVDEVATFLSAPDHVIPETGVG